MSKKRKIFLISLLLFVIFLIENCITVYAGNFDTGTFEGVRPIGQANTAAMNIVSIGVNIVRIVGTGIAIIMITYIAIKYMSAAPNEKAEFKKSATIYVVGAVLIFAGSNVLNIIFSFATNNVKTVN